MLDGIDVALNEDLAEGTFADSVAPIAFALFCERDRVQESFLGNISDQTGPLCFCAISTEEDHCRRAHDCKVVHELLVGGIK